MQIDDNWTVYGPFPSGVTLVPEFEACTIPTRLRVGDVVRDAVHVRVSTRVDLASVLGAMSVRQAVYIYITIHTHTAGAYEFGFGADWWMAIWCNGDRIFDNTRSREGNVVHPIDIGNHSRIFQLKKGSNLVFVRVESGANGSSFAFGDLSSEREPWLDFDQPSLTCMPHLSNTAIDSRSSARLTISKYDVFFDMQEQGFPANQLSIARESDGHTPAMGVENKISAYIHKSILFGYVEDHVLGTHSFITTKPAAQGAWSFPTPVSCDKVNNPKTESLLMNPMIRTRSGVELFGVYHQVAKGKPQGTSMQAYQVNFKDIQSETCIGRRRYVNQPFTWGRPLEFLDYIFLEGGLQLPSGRLMFTFWGGNKDENWRCGVLLSDDEGLSWVHRVVAYEPDISIRDYSSTPAGYNEQTLFLDPSGDIVSIIRGRERLGRGVPGRPFGRDTWYFRAVSTDEGMTWSKPELTNLPGTGATGGRGLVLPDGSYVITCRVPYVRSYYDLPDKDLYGLNIARSFDAGKTWISQFIIQHDPEGNPMTHHYAVSNALILKMGIATYDLIVGQFDPPIDDQRFQDRQRILRLRLEID